MTRGVLNVQFGAAAYRELRNSVDYYNGERAGLGYSFAVEVRQSLARAAIFPKSNPLISRRVRRLRLIRFPYVILYQIRRDSLHVVGIMHTRRHPDSWESIRKQER